MTTVLLLSLPSFISRVFLKPKSTGGENLNNVFKVLLGFHVHRRYGWTTQETEYLLRSTFNEMASRRISWKLQKGRYYWQDAFFFFFWLFEMHEAWPCRAAVLLPSGSIRHRLEAPTSLGAPTATLSSLAEAHQRGKLLFPSLCDFTGQETTHLY